MQIDAIYDHGRLEFVYPVKLKRERIRVRVDVPDEAVEAYQNALPEYSLADFPGDVQKKVARMGALRESILAEFLPAGSEAEITDKQKERWEEFEFRNSIRREQGRPV